MHCVGCNPTFIEMSLQFVPVALLEANVQAHKMVLARAIEACPTVGSIERLLDNVRRASTDGRRKRSLGRKRRRQQHRGEANHIDIVMALGWGE
jgi:hypothetical protein